MNIDKTIIEKINEVSNIDFSKDLYEISSFLEFDYIHLINYFQGDLSLNVKPIFKKLNTISESFVFKLDSLYSFRKRMYSSDFIYFIDKLEQIQDKLNYVKNLNRWLRSSLSNDLLSDSLDRQYMISEGDSLEKISRNILKRENFIDNWFDLALNNSLLEEDYDDEGGRLISVPIEKSNYFFSLNSVVDIINEKSCYGKDLSKNCLFFEDDLLILDNQKTLAQSVNILAFLRKGDNLDFPFLGLQEEMFIGSNRVYFNTPILIRQISETFTTDDTIVDFRITNVEVEQDNFFINFQVRTVLGEILNLSSKI